MSSRSPRVLGAMVSTATILLGGVATAGAATSLNVAAQCSFPGGSVQAATFTVLFPEGLQVGDTAPGAVVSNFASPGLAGLGDTVEFDRNSNRVDITYQGATTSPKPTFPLAPFPAPTYLNGTLLVVESAGPSLTYPQAGPVSAQIAGLKLNLRAYVQRRVRTFPSATDSDNNPETVDVPCTLDAGQALSTTFDVAPRTRPADTTPPSAPGPITVTQITPTSTKFSWGASTDDQVVDSYVVSVGQSPTDGNIPAQTVRGTSVTIAGLKLDTAYTVEVKAIDRGPNFSAPATATFETHEPAADQPLALDLVGAASIATGRSKARLGFSGTLTGRVAGADDSVTGSLKLVPTRLTFTRPDGLTVTAVATFAAGAATTGTHAGGTLRTQSAEAVSFSKVRLLSAISLPTPASCRLAQPAVLALTSGSTVFDVADGGSLTGSVTLGRLADCGVLGTFVGYDLGTAADLSVTTGPATTG